MNALKAIGLKELCSARVKTLPSSLTGRTVPSLCGFETLVKAIAFIVVVSAQRVIPAYAGGLLTHQPGGTGSLKDTR